MRYFLNSFTCMHETVISNRGCAPILNSNFKSGARTTSGELTSGELGLVGSRQQLGGLAGRQGVAGNSGGVVVVADGGAVVDGVLAECEHRVLLVQRNGLVQAVQDSSGRHCTAATRQLEIQARTHFL